jgi:hypothetical protein
MRQSGTRKSEAGVKRDCSFMAIWLQKEGMTKTGQREASSFEPDLSTADPPEQGGLNQFNAGTD